MTVRERLLGISELNIEQKFIQMRNNEFEEYIQELNSFIEDLPKRETELKNALEARDYLAFSRGLVAIRDTLVTIRADELAEECLKQINGMVAVKHEKAEAYLTYLLSVLTILSIDIQMAVYKDEDEEDRVLPPETVMEPEAEKKSVLAVDDNAFLLDSLKKSLQDSDYKLTCVNSGAAALKFLKAHDPDLFILDIEMPGMDGYELAREIRACGKKAPIIFLTGNATKEYVLRAFKSGAADFIVKPVIQKQVLDRIGKFI